MHKHFFGGSVRVFAISDIHVDYEQNMAWVKNLSRQDFQNDILIVAGDISHKRFLFVACIESLVACFKQVLFIPGNHDLWIDNKDYEDSLEKFAALNHLLEALGAGCGWQQASGGGKNTVDKSAIQVFFVPLYSWYDYSFGSPSSELRRIWNDFTACRWPQGIDDGTLCENFLQRNNSVIEQVNNATQKHASNAVTVISFSHFLPRIDVMPSFIPERFRNVYPVLGTAALDKQVRALNANIHVYGHSHVNTDLDIDGVRYINNAFGYVSEQRICRKSLYCILEV